MISIIVPVYNVEKYIRACIESIIHQTKKENLDIELILVDDGSTDDSGKICEEYKKAYNLSFKESDVCKEIIVIHQENRGLSAARNIGIESAYGDYIIFIDADDVVSSNMCFTLWNNLVNNSADISIGNKQNVSQSYELPRENMFLQSNKELEVSLLNNISNLDNNLKVFNTEQALYHIYDKLHLRMIQVTGVLYKKELFKDIRFPFGKCHEDEFVSYKLLANASRVVYDESVIYYRRIRENSIMMSEYSVSNLDILEAYKERKEFFKQKNYSKIYLYAEYDYLKKIMDCYCLIEKAANTSHYTINYIKKELYLEWKKEFNLHKKEVVKIINIPQRIILFVFRYVPRFYKKLYSLR